MTTTEPVAIVGMAVLLPGAGDLTTYWRNLVDGVDAITDVPPHRWDPEFYDPAQAHRPDRLYCRRGGFVDDLATFEPLRFGIMPASIGEIEPDQLITLEVAAAAIADAGGADRLPDPDRIGVIVGRGGILSPAQARYAQRVRMSSQVVGILRELIPDLDESRLEAVRRRFDERLGPCQPEGTIGLVPNLTASRVANRLNLRGPAYTIDAACASSLIAVDQAITELVNGRLDAVLAGGVHHVHDISFWSVFSQLRALSRRGEIRPFDRAADGLLIGEGTGIVILKRLADARRAGDRVYAVIRGSGVSSDGRSASMFNPATTGQTLAIRRAWAAAGLDPTAPDALGLLEAHGTATPTGDAAELATVAEVFGPHHGGDRPVIGSVKSMIGHTMPAAGIAGLVKAVLAVHHGVLPPTLHCTDPRTELERTRFAPIDRARPWTGPGPRRAGVNAFGFGGINAHVIVEEVTPAPVRHRAGPVTSSATGVVTGPGGPVVVDEPEMVLWLAAPDPAAMARLLDDDDRRIRELGVAGARDSAAPGPVPAAWRCRLGLVDPTDRTLAVARRIVAKGEPWRGGRDLWFSPEPLLDPAGGGRLAFVFPGLEAEFAPRTTDLAAHFGLVDRPWSMDDLGRHGAGLIEVGKLLDTALRRIGVEPDTLAGHSIGEWTAAAVSGQVATATMDEFLAGFQATTVEVPGYAFAAVGAGAEQVGRVLPEFPGVVLSHDNAPAQTVVNGPEEQVDRLIEALRARHVLCRKLPFRSVFHTPAFADGLRSIGAALRRWEVRPTRVPVWSATLAAPFPAEPDQVNEIFVRHLMEPVRFRQTVTAMYAAGVRVFLQVGAGQLASLISDNLRGRDHLAMPVNVSHRSGLGQLRRVATALWVEGAAPRLTALDPDRGTTPTVAALRGSPAAPEASGGSTGTGLRRGGPKIRLDLGGPLVRLGAGAETLLGVTAQRIAPTDHGSPPSPSDDAKSPAGALAALGELAGTSGAAAELVALLRDTAQGAVSVLRATTASGGTPANASPSASTSPSAGASPSGSASPPSGMPAGAAMPVAAGDGTYRSELPVSIETMPYLMDHCFFVQPPDWPHPEDRWPVVPATTIVAHMMDAVARVAPGRPVIGVRDARFNRWLIAAPPQRVEVTVRPDGPDRFVVAVGGYARATVEVAAGYPAAPPVWRHDPTTERPPRISAAEMYAERLMFHGPLFHGVTEVHALGDRHVRGVVTAPTPPGSLLDNALQLIGNWLITTQPYRTVALPVRLGHIRFFGPPPPSGTALDCFARVRTIDDTQLVADIQLVLDGRVRAQLEGCVDRRFDSHPKARPAERFPERHPMSTFQPEGWTAAFDCWTDLVTLGMAARGILGNAGYADYERQPATRRKQWLLGRIAAKDAVRARLWAAGHTDVYPIELTVVNDPDGRPRVRTRPGRGFGEYDISVAHCHEVGVAIARPRTPGTPDGPPGVGIDVAEIAVHPESTLTYALSAAELALLDALSEAGPADRMTWFTRFWVAKEAVGKAEGTGLDGRPRRFTVTGADGDGLRVEVAGRRYRVAYRELRNPDDLPPRRYLVGWTESDVGRT